MITLVIQSFGRESEYRRAIFTVWSFYAHVSVPQDDTLVIFFTDNPAYFEHYLHDLPMHYVLLTPEKIQQMRGKIDFLHRMKIALIDEAFSVTQGNLLYVDSDTFFIADPAPKMSMLRSDRSFMHLCEYRFDTLRDAVLPAGESFRAVHAMISSRLFLLSDGSLLNISPERYSWNAGVMFLDYSVKKMLPDVYALTDQLYPETRNHASEQYAFSVILQERVQLSACDDVVFHYWYRIKKQIMDLFLSGNLTQSWAILPASEKKAIVRRWTSGLSQELDNHILTLRDDAIQYFNTDQFAKGYRAAWRALIKDPRDTTFIKDLFYHLRRHIRGKK